MIFIFSLARSGSTWLGKIFDSHPDVLYLHEPVFDDRGYDLLPRYWLRDGPSPMEISNARSYLGRLAENRSLRATGTLPMFRKSYRNLLAEVARRTVIFSAKAAAHPRISLVSSGLRVPNMFSKGREKEIVIKSVSTVGHAECFVRAGLDGFRPIHLIRHPCGYVASMLRGNRLGMMELPTSAVELLDTQAAVQLCLKESDVADAGPCALLAWHWLLQNLEAHQAISTCEGITVNYEELAANPVEQARALFAKVGLAWPRQTERFLEGGTRKGDGYYSVHRYAPAAIDRWRRELDNSQVEQIRRIVERHELGCSYFSRKIMG